MHGANLKRSGRGLAPLMVVALFAAGCGGSDAEQAAEAGGPVTVTVGTLPTANAAAMYLGIEQGFFEEEDLTLEAAVVGSGNEIITGLVSGDYQFGFVGYVSAGIAAANNVPVCVVAANDGSGTSVEDDWQVMAVGANSPIKSAQDLAGKTLPGGPRRTVGRSDRRRVRHRAVPDLGPGCGRQHPVRAAVPAGAEQPQRVLHRQ